MSCLQYLHQVGCAIDVHTCQAAAAGGNLSCLRDIIEHCGVSIVQCEKVLAQAAVSSFPCLKYLLEIGCPCGESAVVPSAIDGNLKALKCCHENGVNFPLSVSVAAAYNGHLECMQYIVDHGGEVAEKTMDRAAFSGHLECVKCLRQIGCEWTSETCRHAAAQGHLAVLARKWLPLERAHHQWSCTQRLLRLCMLCTTTRMCCQSSADVITYFAGLGDLAWVQRLHENGCHWNAHTPPHLPHSTGTRIVCATLCAMAVPAVLKSSLTLQVREIWHGCSSCKVVGSGMESGTSRRARLR